MKHSIAHHRQQNLIAKTGEVRSYDTGKWVRCFRAGDGTIYLHGHKQSLDGGRSIVRQESLDVEAITAKPERAVLARPGLFLALGGPACLRTSGVYSVQAWRSTDDLRTLTEEEARVYVPEGPTREREKGEWYGLYVYRTIIEMPDGELLATMYGNFEADSIRPTECQSKRETKFKQRSFVVTSKDRGRTWHFLSTIAWPRPEDPVGEGFVEPTIVRLDDGRLFSVMRTGHHFPLYSSWSADNGKTWTAPLYTGLERGCDPCLVKLSDGRIALSYGRRFPQGWSRITPGGDGGRWQYPGEGLVNLAISPDGTGQTWVDHVIGRRMGSCYSTIFEVQPNVIFCQVDGWWMAGTGA